MIDFKTISILYEEQYCIDDNHTENTEPQPTSTIEEQMKRLEFIKEETAESHSSEEGRHRISYSKNRRNNIKFLSKHKNDKTMSQGKVKQINVKNK